METHFPPDRALEYQPAPRRRPARFPSLSNRDVRDMVSVLTSAVAGALTVGALTVLIMMLAPAYASTPGTDGTVSTAQQTVTSERLYPTRTIPGDDPAPIPFSGSRGLEVLPVCTCVLPPAQAN